MISHPEHTELQFDASTAGKSELAPWLTAKMGLSPEPFTATKALSIRQPWAWLIVNAGKDIENRSWFSHFRGRFLIHASTGMTRDEYADAFDYFELIGQCPADFAIPSRQELQRGGIIGEATLHSCVTESDSPWFVGPYGFVLKDVKPLPFTPCKGTLGFFRPKF